MSPLLKRRKKYLMIAKVSELMARDGTPFHISATSRDEFRWPVFNYTLMYNVMSQIQGQGAQHVKLQKEKNYFGVNDSLKHFCTSKCSNLLPNVLN
jgi:hypothetical protein